MSLTKLVKTIHKVNFYCLGKNLYDRTISHKLEKVGHHHCLAGMVHDHGETQCPCYLMEYSSTL